MSRGERLAQQECTLQELIRLKQAFKVSTTTVIWIIIIIWFRLMLLAI